MGFLGALFFIGVLVASTIVPVGFLSDILGRKWLFIGTLVLLLVSTIGFLFATRLEDLYVAMFIFGLSFPGRIIVGQNYAYEFCTEDLKTYI